MKTAVITGITGQDGPYLARILIEKGYKVIGTTRSYNIDNSFWKFKYLNIDKDIIVEKLDLMDMSNILGILKKYHPAEIYNLAAQSSVGLSFKEPLGTFYFNTISVNNLLESIKLFFPEIKFYQACSSEMFGKVKKLPITLNTSMNPISPYGVTKMASFFTTKVYRQSYNIFAVNGILFNHESYLRSNNFFVKKVVRSAIMIKRGILNFLEVGNLDLKRDFGYSPKYMEAVWKMLQLDSPEDFIICSGKSILLRDIVEYVFDKLNISMKLVVENEELVRPDEIEDIYGDNSKAKKKLKWEYNLSFFDVLDILIEEEINNLKT